MNYRKLTALIMAGGKGSRLDIKEEKPLVTFKGRPLIEHVIRALDGSKYVDSVLIATSKFTRNTEKEMRKKPERIVRTPGRGYVKDMVYTIKKLDLGKTIITSADLPLLTSENIDFVIEEYFKEKTPAMTVMIPLKVFEKLGLKPDLVLNDLVPSGVNIVDGHNLDGEEGVLITEKIEFAFNINTLEDLEKATSA